MTDAAQIEIRPARAEDHDAVFAFTARTWGDDGDYIPYVWDQWLADQQGTMLVAIAEGRAVGLIHVAMLAADEAWIEGIRVDPALRRQGIGRALTMQALAAARERGAKVARLFTDEDNSASQQMVAGFGFVRVAAFVGFTAPAEARDEPEALPPEYTLRTPGTGDLARIWAFLQASNLVPLNGGLLVQGWQARALSAGVLEQRLAAGEVHTLEAWDAIQALAVVHANPRAERGPRLSVQYLDGVSEGIGRLALALRHLAAREGLNEVSLLLPQDVLILRDAMDGAGYTPRDDHATWCYARAL
jgi:ribosomal protein S18 acetylase RimI-like enzyme